MKKPLILAFDTSCDDTSVALTSGYKVLANIISSQVELHKEFGGVFPTVAKQAHKENIDPTTKLALKRAGKTLSEVAGVAVTVGPGLAPSLEVGITYASQLAAELGVPLLAINHLEGHLWSSLVERNSPPTKDAISSSITESAAPIIYPVLGVIVSGGHTDFILVKGEGQYERLGFTIDDAAGECLDKVGRMLGLGYPAGAVIEQFAKKGDPARFDFPLPMTQVKDFNVSFSGMKTFSRNLIAKLDAAGSLDKQAIYDFSAGIQMAVFRHILYKLNKILEEYKVTELWLGGGVAANVSLRKLLRTKARIMGLKFRFPYAKNLCSDNAAMIGVVGGQKFLRGEGVQPGEKLDRQPNLHLGEV